MTAHKRNPNPNLTELLNRWASGNLAARDELFALVYPEVKFIVLRQMAGRNHSTFQPTEVVHEAYLKMSEGNVFGWTHRAQFFKLAAQIVRQVLVDHARGQQAQKRGAGAVVADIPLDSLAAASSDVDVLALDQALKRLGGFDPMGARIVELRYFGGCTIPEVAVALDSSTATVSRRWHAVRAWLRRELEEPRERRIRPRRQEPRRQEAMACTPRSGSG